MNNLIDAKEKEKHLSLHVCEIKWMSGRMTQNCHPVGSGREMGFAAKKHEQRITKFF